MFSGLNQVERWSKFTSKFASIDIVVEAIENAMNDGIIELLHGTQASNYSEVLLDELEHL